MILFLNSNQNSIYLIPYLLHPYSHLKFKPIYLINCYNKFYIIMEYLIIISLSI